MSCPLYPRKRTCAAQTVMSALGQKRTSLGLFEHLVSEREQFRRDIQSERFGGLAIDYQLELDRGLDRKLGRLRILEDAIGIGRRAPKIIDQVTSVGQQAAEFSEGTDRIDGRETVARRQQGDLRAMSDHEG